MADAETNSNSAGQRMILLEKLLGFRSELNAPRQQFQNFYDAWLADADLADAPASFMHAIIRTLAEARGAGIQLDPARSNDAIALVLAALGSEYSSANCFSAAVTSGMFHNSGDKNPTDQQVELIKGFLNMVKSDQSANSNEPVAGRLQSGNLHAMTAPEKIWTDPGHLLPALLLARRRLCKILTIDNAENPIVGSGFLIGPSTIITNFHVVKDQPVTLTDKQDIRIFFDYSLTTGLQHDDGSVHHPQLNWCIAKSATGIVGPVSDNEFWWNDRTTRNDWLSSVADNLDYAIIQLESSPGLQRGWYDIRSFGKSASLEGCWVLHHPGGNDQTVTEGNLHYVKSGNPSRLFHSASTVHGSSGGLMLNSSGLPIGLHYMGLGVDVFNPGDKVVNIPRTVVNVAIPLSEIAKDLAQKNVLDSIVEIKTIAPNRGCLDGRRPVFGREKFFVDLGELFKGEKPIMMVSVTSSNDNEPISQPGKSFSAEMVASIFPQPGNIHIVFEAGELKADGRKMAALMLEAFAPDLVADLPDDPDTTTPAFIKRIVDFVGRSLRQRAGNQIVWLILDDLDKHEVSDASGRQFLNSLYASIHRHNNLRIILIGLDEDNAPGGIERSKLISSRITDADISDRRKLFVNWLNQRGGRDIGIDEIGQKLLTRTVASYAGEEAPLAQMAKFVTDHMSEVTNDIFGEIDSTEDDQ